MSNKPLNVALIGCGRIAGHHCKAIAEVEGVKLAAVSTFYRTPKQ